jgi:hypothetical protein
MYGNYVVQYVIEKPCSIEKKNSITEKFVGRFDDYIYQKFGSNVMETFIKCKMNKFVEALCAYFSNKDRLLSCVCNQFGNYVVQTLLNNYQGEPIIEPVLEVRSALLVYQRELPEDSRKRLRQQSVDQHAARTAAA